MRSRRPALLLAMAVGIAAIATLTTPALWVARLRRGDRYAFTTQSSSSAFSSVETNSSDSSSSARTPSLEGAALQLELYRKDREKRTKEFAREREQSRQAERNYREIRERYRKRQSSYRSECRVSVRKANRDTKMPTILRCYRGELADYREFLRKEREYFGKTAGVSERVRRDTLSRYDILLDAVSTIIFAIDSGVYTVPEELLEAKKNLYERYQKGVWDSVLTLRADRLLTWVAAALALDFPVEEGSAPLCLLVAEERLRAIVDEEVARKQDALQEANTNLSDCIDTLEALKQENREVLSSSAQSS